MKDEAGNVISIFEYNKEVAKYHYDAWGNCTIEREVDGLGTLNPIRWKSQYYDAESGMYYIGGRYYDPDIKRYISAVNPEEMQSRAGTVYGINPYLFVGLSNI